MRRFLYLNCLLLTLLLVGCGGKDKKAENEEQIPPNTKLVSLKLPNMT